MMKADPDESNHRITRKVPAPSGGGDNINNHATIDSANSGVGGLPYRADHGASFVPGGAGPEHYAPKSLDHFKRGYEERTAQRDKEFYSSGGGNGSDEEDGRDPATVPSGEEAVELGGGGGPPITQPPSSQQQQHQQQQQQEEPPAPPARHQPQRAAYGRGSGGGSFHGDEDVHNDYHDDNYTMVNNNSRFGRGVSGGYGGGGGGGRRDDYNNSSSNNGTGFGGRGGRGTSGNRRYMDDPWGYRDRPTVLQGLDINALMDRLAELSHDSNPDRLFAELDRVRDEYKQIFDTGKAMTALISVAARRKQIGLGHAVWDWMDLAKLPKNTFHYNSMISVAEKAKNYQQALDLLNEMTERNIAKNEVTFSSAISACEKCGQWKIALDLLNSMEDEGVARTAIAYNAAISACEKGMVPQKACEVFQRMKRENIAPSVVSYSALISAAEKGSQWKLALEILEEMKQEGFHGNVVAYSAAISALAKGQQWRKALELFREIQSHGGTPSIVTYNATMTALEKGMQWERALDLFEEMKMRNLPITVVSYGSAISACDKGFQYRQCLEFLDEMTEMGIPKNVIIFGAAMSCMEKCSRADIGFQLMKRMKEEGIAPNVHIYNSAISACARCNLWEKGYELFQEMDKVNVRKDVVTYNAVLDAVACNIRLGRMLFEEGVQKGFYAKVSRLGEHWFELDLHFLSLGGGEIALGWWFEECLVPYLVNTEKLKNVKSISIVTGYGKTRTRGRRYGDDGMRKRCKAMLQFMNIQELPQPNAGRIHVDKESLIKEVNKNGGKVIFNLDGYIRWKENETTVNAVPDTPQKIRARFKPQVIGSGRPPFTRVENEHTSPEYRLENQKKRGFYVDDKPVASVFDEMNDAAMLEDSEQDVEPRGAFRGGTSGGRDFDDNRKGISFRPGGGGRGYGDDRRSGGYRDGNDGGRGFGGSDRSYGDSRGGGLTGRSYDSNRGGSEYRDNDKGGRGYTDRKRIYNDESAADRAIDDRRGAFNTEKESLSERRSNGGFGRGSWRGGDNPSSHYGPGDVKHESRRGGYEDAPPRDYSGGSKHTRFDDRSVRVQNQATRFPSDRQDDHYAGPSEPDRRNSHQYGDDGHYGPSDDVLNEEYGRQQRVYDNDYSGRKGDDLGAPKHRVNHMGGRQGSNYSNDNHFGTSGQNRANYRNRLPDDSRTGSFVHPSDRVSVREREAAVFDGNGSGQYTQQQNDHDPRKRSYEEPERRTSAIRGYALEPQSQKRRLS